MGRLVSGGPKVSAQRKQSDEMPEGAPSLSPALSTQALRLAQPPVEAPKGEERLSIFWRVFGGTLLSIAALVALTAYQQYTATVNDLRAAMTRLNEAHADLAKKDDLNNRTSSIWASLKDVNAELPAMKVKEAQLEGQLKAAEQERKELQNRVQKLSERLAELEGRWEGSPPAKASAPEKTAPR
jgi:uncharacterized protein YhaN